MPTHVTCAMKLGIVNRRLFGGLFALLLLLVQGCESIDWGMDPNRNATVFLKSSIARGKIEFENLDNHRLFLADIDDDGWARCELPAGRHLITRRVMSTMEANATTLFLISASGWTEVRGILDVPENGVACYVGNLVFQKKGIKVELEGAAAAEYYRRNLSTQRPRLVTKIMTLEN